MPGFTHLKSLRTLELIMQPISHPFVCSLLDTCQNWCTKLAILILRITPPPLNVALHTYSSTYANLDQRLGSGSLRGLKEVCLRYDSPPDDGSVWLWVKAVFPQLMHASVDRGLRVRLVNKETAD